MNVPVYWEEGGECMAKERRCRDMVIIGGGLAGLTAALYGGRMNLSVLVLESGLVGGQIGTDHRDIPITATLPDQFSDPLGSNHALLPR